MALFAGRARGVGHAGARVARVALIGRVRSGSTVLRRTLASHPLVEDRGEILNPEQPGNFWDWLHRRARLRPALVRPERQLEEFASYLRHGTASRQPGVSHVVLDIKLESIGALGRHWQELDAQTALSPVLGSCSPIIFLRRRDQVARYVSNQVAFQSGSYHHREPSAQPRSGTSGPVEMSIAELTGLRTRLERNVREEDELLEIMRWFVQVHELWYEDLFDESGDFASHLSEDLSTLLELDDRFERKPALARTSQGSVWEHFADPDLARRILLSPSDDAAFP